MDELITPESLREHAGSVVPLVLYTNGERKIVGEATVHEDGTFTSRITDEEFDPGSPEIGEFSFGFKVTLDREEVGPLGLTEVTPLFPLKFKGDEMNSKDYVEGVTPVGTYLDKARGLVFTVISDRISKIETTEYAQFDISDVYVVWFSKTLQNWKALVSTTIPDNMYYEVTYDGNKKQAYVDSYQKIDNVTISDPVDGE